MIICTEKDDGLTPFERKYLFTEARGEKKDRKNVRQISIDMSSKKGKTTINGTETDTDDVDVDDTDDIDLSELDDEANASDTSVDPDDDTDDDSTGDDMDIDLEDPEDSSMGDDGTDASDDISTEPDDGDDSGEDSGSTDTDSDTSGDDGGSDDVAIEPDDDSDSGSDDSGSSDASSDDSGDSEDSSEESPEDKEEAIHKQALFSKFQNLYESIGNYNAKLDEIVGKTDMTNHNYKEINDNLKQLRDFLYDYMIIKFKDASYTESMLFYQRSIAVVNISLDMLENVRKIEADK